MNSGARFALLAAAIRHELKQLARLQQEAGHFGQQFETALPSLLEIRGLGNIVHDFYTGAERIFEKVSVELDGGVPAGRAWHRDLLLAMTLEVPSRRPALLSEATAQQLEELLRFRHLFRNVYGFELQWARLRPLLEKVGSVGGLFAADAQEFLAFLDSASSAPT